MSERPVRLTILGATGSIGRSALSVVAMHPGRFELVALVAGSDVAGLAALARSLRPRLAVLADPSRLAELRAALAGSGIATAAGEAAVREAAAMPVDRVVAGIVGSAGLLPTLEAVRQGAVVALANKECLVCAGRPFLEAAERHGARILPVDSEHSAIFQCLAGSRREDLERIVLTASGGPFRSWERERMASVTPEQALAHPNWRMGAKITVDSATLMNKGLEVIEAHHLFGLPEERIGVVVHPQSILHGLAVFRDGSMLAQLGLPDMRAPLAYALAWPEERLPSGVAPLDLTTVGRLEFEPPDPARFPTLDYAREALRRGGAAPAVLNAANEVAVHAFLERRIGFLDIARLIERVLAQPVADAPLAGIEDALEADREARRLARVELARLADETSPRESGRAC